MFSQIRISNTGPISFNSPRHISMPGLLFKETFFWKLPLPRVCLSYMSSKIIYTHQPPSSINFFLYCFHIKISIMITWIVIFTFHKCWRIQLQIGKRKSSEYARSNAESFESENCTKKYRSGRWVGDRTVTIFWSVWADHMIPFPLEVTPIPRHVFYYTTLTPNG